MTARKQPRREMPIILGMTDKQLQQTIQMIGLGLSFREMRAVREYFRMKNRNPTMVELQTIDQTWSEHCFHKTFKGKIRFNGIEIDSLFKTYIARATQQINPSWCFSVFEDNAGIVDFDKGFGIAAKVETHNHPSAVEPFGGAATGVGGVIRDVLGVWADPIACTDVLGFGPLDYSYDKLPFGLKHPKYVYRGVVAGIGSYGNNMGIPTVNGAVYFDESYVGNVIVYCGCIGILPLSKFRKNAKAGDLIILAGGKTGRDGIHGVTFASSELTEKSEEISRPAVQIADPIEEEKLKRAIIEIRDLELATSITDLGGGGLSSAVGETAKKFDCGAKIELDKVPLKYPDLSSWEIYISESQERMLLTVPSKSTGKVLEIFEKEEVEANVIGTLTKDRLLILSHRGEEVARIEMSFLFDPPRITRTGAYKASLNEEPEFEEPQDLNETLLQLLSSPNIKSKENVVRNYDHEVQGNTVIKPLQGKIAGPNDAAVLKPLDASWKGVVVSCGMNPNYGKIDPYWMAASAIDEAVRNNVAVGGRRIALLDNFVWGNPERPDRLGTLVRACKACYDTAVDFGMPFISGKDSLYNESALGSVTPTLLITALGILPDVRCAVTMESKSAGDPVYIVGRTCHELGGSEYYRLRGFLGRKVPKVKAEQAVRIFSCVSKAIDSGLVRACHDLSEGGLGVCGAEMSFTGDYGLALDLRKIPRQGLNRNDFMLFSESNSRFLIEVPLKKKDDFETAMKGNCFAEVGKTTQTKELRVVGLDGSIEVNVPLEQLEAAWKGNARGGT